jgi:hypothetical protein
MSRVLFAPVNLKKEIIPQQRKKLFRVHFPGSEISLETSGGWNGLELEFPKWKGSRGDWVVSKRVVNYNKLKWTHFKRINPQAWME